jgi:hypothetical protein
MSRREREPAVSDLRLERYRLGELPPGERDEIGARVADDPVLRSRVSALEESDRAIAAAYPARQMAEAVRQRAREAQAARPSRRRSWLVPATAVGAFACLAIAVAATVWLRQPAADETTIKGGGGAALVIHRRLGEGSEELSRGATVRQGDQVRIGYRAAGRAYGVILSIDGRGTVSQHLPRAGEEAVALQPSGTVFLDFAYELDDAPRWEAFYFVASDARFDLEPIRRAVREAAGGGRVSPAPLDLPRGFTQFLFPLSKESR